MFQDCRDIRGLDSVVFDAEIKNGDHDDNHAETLP
jgi:hypothetical protein